MATTTYQTKYGNVSIFNNDLFIHHSFKQGKYWDEEMLEALRPMIDPSKNILEFGGHCGTSTLVYADMLKGHESKVYVFEPQRALFDLLCHNVSQNSLERKISAVHGALFCFVGAGNMHNIDMDGAGGEVKKRYAEEQNLPCNFGGIGLGSAGESTPFYTMDSLALRNVGFIHSDAQGSESFIFWAARETLRRERPIILYEEKEHYGDYLYKQVVKSYPEYAEASQFDLKTFCMNELGYQTCIEKFQGGIDNLLIP